MRKIIVTIEIDDGKKSRMSLSKVGPEKEIDVLAGAVTALFIKSKQALKIAEGNKTKYGRQKNLG